MKLFGQFYFPRGVAVHVSMDIWLIPNLPTPILPTHNSNYHFACSIIKYKLQLHIAALLN